jgi:uncharacterized protein YpiB (UPF0302 family)
MSSLIAFLTALPELIKLIKALKKQADYQLDDHVNKKEEIKKSVNRIAKAIEAKDEKALNDMFRNL